MHVLKSHPDDDVIPIEHRVDRVRSSQLGPGRSSIVRRVTTQAITRSHFFIKHSLGYMEALMHMLRMSLGIGVFAMGYVFKCCCIETGLLFMIPTFIIVQFGLHAMINCSERIQELKHMRLRPDLPETVYGCFECGPMLAQHLASFMRGFSRFMIVTLQLGICSIYIIFITVHIMKFLHQHDITMDIRILILIVTFIVFIFALTTNLKHVAVMNLIGNIFMVIGTCLVISDLSQDNDIADFTDFGTAENNDNWEYPILFSFLVYLFSGCNLLLPLKNEMQDPHNYDAECGVLNVSNFIYSGFSALMGTMAYIKYGESVKGSFSLNMPNNLLITECTMIILSLAMVFSFTLQFYIAAVIIWSKISDMFVITDCENFYEVMLRLGMIIATLSAAMLLPNLVMLLCLVSSTSSILLSLFFPQISDLVMRWPNGEFGCLSWRFFVNVISIMLSLVGVVTGISSCIHFLIKYPHYGL